MLRRAVPEPSPSQLFLAGAHRPNRRRMSRSTSRASCAGSPRSQGPMERDAAARGGAAGRGACPSRRHPRQRRDEPVVTRAGTRPAAGAAPCPDRAAGLQPRQSRLDTRPGGAAAGQAGRPTARGGRRAGPGGRDARGRRCWQPNSARRHWSWRSRCWPGRRRRATATPSVSPAKSWRVRMRRCWPPHDLRRICRIGGRGW